MFKVIKIGTDCSGIEAPIQALNILKVTYSHEFSSEINKFARESIRANYKPRVLFEDMTVNRDLPKIDMYVCGFPCQPFSLAGNRLGSKDPRGNIFMNCIKTIQKTNPSLFILENVKGIITSEEGQYFRSMTNILSKLIDYKVEYMILNTKHYGIPQNRERIFIIGLLKTKIICTLRAPIPVGCKDIRSYIDKKNTSRNEYLDSQTRKYDKFKDAVFVNIDMLQSTSSKASSIYSSSLIASSNLWCIPMHRKATVNEYLSLQGFPKDFKQVVSDTQLKRQIGNSMSVNVLVHLFKECFKSLGWINYRYSVTEGYSKINGQVRNF